MLHLDISKGIPQDVSLFCFLITYVAMVISVFRPIFEIAYALKYRKEISSESASVIKNYLPCVLYFVVAVIFFIVGAST